MVGRGIAFANSRPRHFFACSQRFLFALGVLLNAMNSFLLALGGSLGALGRVRPNEFRA